MSRIGRKPVIIPEGVEVSLKGRLVHVKGKLGELSYELPEEIQATIEDRKISLVRLSDKPKIRALHGLSRALVQNMVVGVSQGFVKRLELRGTGYRASVSGQKLTLNVGYSHPVVLEFPKEIVVKIEGTTTKEQLPTTIISVSGFDKQKVGHYADLIRRVRPVEPYKGKGIRYEGEYVRRKAGKVG